MLLSQDHRQSDTLRANDLAAIRLISSLTLGIVGSYLSRDLLRRSEEGSLAELVPSIFCSSS